MTKTPIALCFVTTLFGWSVAIAQQQKLSPQDIAFFEKKIRPILVAHCYSCHSAQALKTKKLRGGLQLDNHAALRKGGDSGAVIVPGKPKESLLVQALNYESLEMPPKGKLPASVIADFQEWVARGALDPRRGTAVASSKIDLERGRKHWAYPCR